MNNGLFLASVFLNVIFLEHSCLRPPPNWEWRPLRTERMPLTASQERVYPAHQPSTWVPALRGWATAEWCMNTSPANSNEGRVKTSDRHHPRPAAPISNVLILAVRNSAAAAPKFLGLVGLCPRGVPVTSRHLPPMLRPTD
ncbi:hypothetical protein LZ31DRAFT_240403 [Colletotrichum somersetense]|nr:hypothetical protein LZ31DRAFT_240403 [Colletotrichum somersetense]